MDKYLLMVLLLCPIIFQGCGHCWGVDPKVNKNHEAIIRKIEEVNHLKKDSLLAHVGHSDDVCLVDSISSLFFSKKGIALIPAEIGNLSSVNFISLDSNEIKSFPDEITQIRNLNEIKFEGNMICNPSAKVDSFLSTFDNAWKSKQICL